MSKYVGKREWYIGEQEQHMQVSRIMIKEGTRG